MEFEKIKEIIVDQLGVDESDVNMDSSFTDDLGADSLDLVELSWPWKKNLIWRFPMRMRKISKRLRMLSIMQKQTRKAVRLLKVPSQSCRTGKTVGTFFQVYPALPAQNK